MGAFLASPIGSWLRVFLAAMLNAWLLDLTEVADISFDAWETYVVAGLVSTLPVIVAYLNAADPRFGKT